MNTALALHTVFLLFFDFIKIGALGFGGGYAMLPLIESLIVDIRGFISPSEFIDLVTISQMTPGPILINSATFVGIKVAGILGGIIATVGAIAPSCIIVTFLAMLYYKYRTLDVVQNMLKFLRPVGTGLIAAAGATIFVMVVFGGDVVSAQNIDIMSFFLCVLSFAAIRFAKINPAFVVLGSGFVGIILFEVLKIA